MDVLTAEQASKLLGISLSTFYRGVKEGIYPSVKDGRGRKFPRAAIEASRLVQQNATEGLSFRRATNADIWRRWERNMKIYGEEDMVSYQRALEWRTRNPDICMSAYDTGEMYGGVVIMPIDEPVILSLARDEIREKDIPLASIHAWSDKGLSSYVPTISIIPSGDHERDARRAAFLIKNTVRWAISLHLQHDIKNWYTIGTTPEGRAISEALGFQEFLSLENGERKAYRLNAIEQGSTMLKRFIARLENEAL